MKEVALLSEQDRKAIFNETANSMHITAAAVEKDFWICWVLLHLFEDKQLNQHLVFKGGTSLSKCYTIIERFSEDIDLILDWTQLTTENPTDTSLSKTQQNKLNQNINDEAQAYIATTLLQRLVELMGDMCQLEIDTENPHTINVIYPKAFASEYLRPQVRLEIGPLAAMVPMALRPVQPYAAKEFPQLFQQASINVPCIVAERTFWEKLTILHAEAHRSSNKPIPSRYARHYYDVHKMVEAGIHVQAFKRGNLLSDVVNFKKTFYPSAWANYDKATFAELVLLPSAHHLSALKNDYGAMQEMLFGNKPRFKHIIDTLKTLERDIRGLHESL